MEPVALVGFMGTGKTTVGRSLARAMGWEFVDADAEVSRRTDLSVKEIFARHGEKGFREMEADALEDLAGREGLVIGCGGGIVTTERGRRALKDTFVVYMAADEDALVVRLEGTDRRPLLAGLSGQELKDRIHELLVVRRPLYADVADMAVDSARPTEQVVKRIRKELAAHGYDDRG